jgi:hypothetical protein
MWAVMVIFLAEKRMSHHGGGERGREMGNEVLLWVFLAVGRDRKVVDGSERGGAGGCWERDKGGKNERKGKKKVSEFKS